MKAIAINVFVEQYADLAVSDVPAPTPKAGEVLVTITHAGLNHVDLLYARGAHQNNASGLVTPPFVLGLEFAGTVAAVAVARRGGGGGGGKCREAPPPRFHVGERVWGSAVGALAEQIAVPESSLQRVPAGWRAEEVAGLGAATAPVSYGALVRVAKVQSGERVLVHAAAGGLGVVAGQIARALGVRVVATVGSAAKADVVRRQLGVEVDAVLRYDEAGWEKEVLEASGGKGVDVVFDTVGLVEKSLRCLRYGGRVVVAGFVGREDKMEKAAMNRILLKGAAVLGYRYGESGRRNPHENAAVWRGLNAMLQRGQIRPVIYGQYPGLESVPRALEDLAARKVFGKAIIHLSPSQRLHSKI